MSHTPNLFALKLFVISLGVVLLGGIATVLGSIAYKAHKENNVVCNDATFHYGSASGKLANITPQGKEVQLVVTSDKDVKLLTVGRCSGELLQTLTITP